MVGPWPLAPHHDYLQYIHNVHLMQWGQNWGVTVTLVISGFINRNIFSYPINVQLNEY